MNLETLKCTKERVGETKVYSCMTSVALQLHGSVILPLEANHGLFPLSLNNH